MKLKILRHQNCCYFPLDLFFKKDWPDNSNIATELVLP